jgi:hypothetical protein
MACSDGEALWIMPFTIALESPTSGDGLKLPEKWVMNSISLEWMVGVLSELDAEQKWVSPVVMLGLCR